MRRVTLLLFLIASVNIGGYFGYKHLQKNSAGTSDPMQAISADALFIFETEKPNSLWEKIVKTNVIWEELTVTNYFKKIHSTGILIDSIIRKNDNLNNFFTDKHLVVSIQLINQQEIGYQFVFSSPSHVDPKEIFNTIDESIEGEISVLYKSKGIEIFQFTKDDVTIYFANHKGLILISPHHEIIRNSIHASNEKTALAYNSHFMKIRDFSGKFTDGNCYINQKKIPQLVQNMISINGMLNLKDALDFSGWYAYDITIAANSIKMSGFTFPSNKNNFIELFSQQEPQFFKVTQIIPENVAYLYAIGVEDFPLHLTNYEAHLQKIEKFDTYERKIQKMNDEFGLDVPLHLTQWVGKEFGTFTIEPFNQLNQDENFTYFEIKNEEYARSNLNKLANVSSNNTPESHTYQGYTLKKININNLHQRILGNIFQKKTSVYFTRVGNYMMFCSSLNEFKRLINCYETKKVLANSEYFDAFSEGLSETFNILIYNNIARSTEILKKQFNKKYRELIDLNIKLIQKFEASGIQFSKNDSDKFYANVYFKHNPIYKKKPSSLWEVTLDTTMSCKPFVVKNHNNNTKEVFVQDHFNKIYLINNKGKILWKKQLNEPIEGLVYQIDAYKNSKLQLLFNTKTKLYLIDRNGKNVGQFPIKLPAEATGRLSIFDYERNKNYRILIGCENGQVYNYDNLGNPVLGWEFKPMKYSIIKDIKRFSIDNKDYILFVDESGKTKFTDRRGKIRYQLKRRLKEIDENPVFVELDKNINNCKLIYTQDGGQLMKMKLKGKLETVSLPTVSGKHQFCVNDINKNDTNEYIITNDTNIFVFGSDTKKQFDYGFPSNSSLSGPSIYKFRKGNKIGVTDYANEEIYLFNPNGELEYGFPLYGSTKFSISDINLDGRMELITGSQEGTIYCYTLVF